MMGKFDGIVFCHPQNLHPTNMKIFHVLAANSLSLVHIEATSGTEDAVCIFLRALLITDRC